jgi:CheY-like chemotaxis protein
LPLKEGKYVKWFVKDQGSGIPKENLQKIFDPYFTTKPTGSARGMGLGLAICYSIIQKHDGFIAAESEPGTGSTFFVYLPAFPKESVKGTEVDPHAVSRGKILVMDSEETVRHSTGIVLNYLGYKVEFSHDGHETTDLYRKAMEMNQPFSTVILASNIKGDKGAKETIGELLKIDPQVKAILSGEYIDDPVAIDFRKYGFREMVSIPYDMERMKEVLNELLG